MLLPVKIAPLGLAKVIKDKPRAPNAVPVNLMMLPVLLRVIYVRMVLILVEKEETVVALIAQLGGHRKVVVLNANLVVLENMVLGVKFVLPVNIAQPV